jgi:hypothetical protein
MEGAPPVANQIDLFMHFLGASRDGLVARPVEMDKLSSSDIPQCKMISQSNHACNFLPHNFWSTYECIIKARILVLVEWSYRSYPPNHVDH